MVNFRAFHPPERNYRFIEISLCAALAVSAFAILLLPRIVHFTALHGWPPILQGFFMFACFPLLQLAVILLCARLIRGKRDFRQALELKFFGDFSGVYTLKLFAAMYFLMLILQFLMKKIGAFFSVPLPMQDAVVLSMQFDTPLFCIFAASAVLLAPLVEELLFRHLLFCELARFIPPIYAALAGATIFSACHLNLLQAPSLFCMGFLLQLAYVQNKSLLAPILIHMANNLLTVLILTGARMGWLNSGIAA